VPIDVDILLRGPTGANLIVMSDAGGTSPSSNVTLTLDDSAAIDLPSGSPMPTGTYRPKNYADAANGGNNDNFPAPAPAPSANTSLGAAFNNTNPNGTWSLYVIDDASGDIGSIAGGWTLNITQGVAAQATTTSIVSSNTDYIQTNQAVSFTATVRKQSDNTVVGAVGSVTFKEGATTLSGPTALNASGQAAFNAPASTFNANNHTITAEYSDASAVFLPSSASLEQVVDNPTTRVASTFTNTGTITIPQSGLALQTPAKASPYSSHLNVTGLTGSVSNVTITLTNFTHAIPKDVDMLLVSPLGGTSNLIILSDIGGTTPSGTVTLTLSDAAAPTLPTTSPLASGTFKPTNINTGTDDSFVAPAPAPSANSTLNGAFAGVNPNGVWRLYIMDDAGGDIGTLSGWSMTFTTTGDAATTTTLTTSQPDFSITGTSVTFTATVMSGVTPVTVGTVTFREGATVLAGPVSLNATGQASFSTSALTIGDHTITADYSGVAGQFNLSSGNVKQSVDSGTVRTGNSYCNSGSIPIPNPAVPGGGSPANPYPSHVTVSGLGGLVSKVSVRFNGLFHTNPDDIDALLAFADFNSKHRFDIRRRRCNRHIQR
jgi:subtilisin-like proprotein convertase family protein